MTVNAKLLKIGVFFYFWKHYTVLAYMHFIKLIFYAAVNFFDSHCIAVVNTLNQMRYKHKFQLTVTKKFWLI